MIGTMNTSREQKMAVTTGSTYGFLYISKKQKSINLKKGTTNLKKSKIIGIIPSLT